MMRRFNFAEAKETKENTGIIKTLCSFFADRTDCSMKISFFYERKDFLR
ncbi:MAG: hypothetical protein ILP13_02425 [Lachnospiraceae bacterium]|nr:hypothetical protein [Lachnospiraceae bacterium]